MNLQSGNAFRDIGPLLKLPITYQKGSNFYLGRSNFHRGRGFGNVFAGLYR